jgi:hypothetical protein
LANQAKPFVGSFGEQQRLDRNTADSGVRPPTEMTPAIVEALCLKDTCTVEQVGGVNADELATLNKLLHRLERFWTDQIVYQMKDDDPVPGRRQERISGAQRLEAKSRATAVSPDNRDRTSGI